MVPGFLLLVKCEIPVDPSHLERVSIPVLQLLELKRLLDVVKDPHAKGLDRRLHRGVGGYQDDLGLRVHLLGFLQDVDSGLRATTPARKLERIALSKPNFSSREVS